MHDVVRHGVVVVLDLDELHPLLDSVRPRPHQLTQHGGRQLDVAPRLAQHPVQLAVVRGPADQLRQGIHGRTVGGKSPAQVTKR
jgi:hypothetical protein